MWKLYRPELASLQPHIPGSKVQVPQLVSSDPSAHCGVKSHTWLCGIHCPLLQAKLDGHGPGVVGGAGEPVGNGAENIRDKITLCMC